MGEARSRSGTHTIEMLLCDNSIGTVRVLRRHLWLICVLLHEQSIIIYNVDQVTIEKLVVATTISQNRKCLLGTLKFAIFNISILVRVSRTINPFGFVHVDSFVTQL